MTPNFVTGLLKQQHELTQNPDGNVLVWTKVWMKPEMSAAP